MINTEAQRHRVAIGVWGFAPASLCLCVSVFMLTFVVSAAEIHAVWDHSGRGLYPGNWPKTMQVLKSAHVTDVFVNVAGPDFAHYPSSFLPRSKAFSDYGDQMAACLRAAQGTGIRVHAWIICFNATRGVPKSLETFKARGWRMKERTGRSRHT